MAKFHINSNGEPGKCSATQGKCPFGGAEDHFTSIEAAREQAERQLSDANGWSSKRKGGAPVEEKISIEVKVLMEEIEKYENNPARHNYGFPEDEMIRYNIDQAISERKEKLRGMLPYADFTYLRSQLSSADKSYGLEQAAIRIANNDPKLSWESVMGNQRRTAKAIKTYENVRNSVVSNRPDAQVEIENWAKKHRDQNVFARAYEQKQPIPEQYDAAFEKNWADPKTGEKFLTGELNRLKSDKAEFDAGRLSATKVVGTGLRNPKMIAEEYFAKRESELTRALKTRGRSYPVTVSNVMYTARKEGWPYSA